MFGCDVSNDMIVYWGLYFLVNFLVREAPTYLRYYNKVRAERFNLNIRHVMSLFDSNGLYKESVLNWTRKKLSKCYQNAD